MFDEKLRAEIIHILTLDHANKEDQDVALAHVENIAIKRLTRAIPEMLTDEQLNHVESMRTAKEDNDTIVAWIREQIPGYDELFSAVIKDVAVEIAKS
jgi:hypothetical protein